MHWPTLRDFLLLFLGVCMVIVLLAVRAELNELNALTLENRVATCRMTKKLGIPFDPTGPCSIPEVKERVEELSLARR